MWSCNCMLASYKSAWKLISWCIICISVPDQRWCQLCYLMRYYLCLNPFTVHCSQFSPGLSQTCLHLVNMYFDICMENLKNNSRPKYKRGQSNRRFLQMNRKNEHKSILFSCFEVFAFSTYPYHSKIEVTMMNKPKFYACEDYSFWEAGINFTSAGVRALKENSSVHYKLVTGLFCLFLWKWDQAVVWWIAVMRWRKGSLSNRWNSVFKGPEVGRILLRFQNFKECLLDHVNNYCNRFFSYSSVLWSCKFLEVRSDCLSISVSPVPIIGLSNISLTDSIFICYMKGDQTACVRDRG